MAYSIINSDLLTVEAKSVGAMEAALKEIALGYLRKDQMVLIAGQALALVQQFRAEVTQGTTRA